MILQFLKIYLRVLFESTSSCTQCSDMFETNSVGLVLNLKNQFKAISLIRSENRCENVNTKKIQIPKKICKNLSAISPKLLSLNPHFQKKKK